MDTKVHYALVNREMSSFMVSVGLGLMLETFFEPLSPRADESRSVVKVNIDKYKIHYFNVYTILRNILSAVPGSETKKMILKSRHAPESLLEVLLNELEMIKTTYTNSTCEPILFIPDYSEVYKTVDNSNKPENLNDTKSATKEMFDKTINLYIKSEYKSIETYKIKTELPSTNSDVLITTHIAYDLLNVNRIRRLILAESHTGVLKDKSMFNTKYHSLGKKYDKTIFPFQKQLLLILGDNTIIKPFKISYRMKLAERAMGNKWTNYTSESRVKNVIKDLDRELQG